MAVADDATNLHAAADDLEGVRDGLRDEAGDAASGQLGPVLELGGLAGVGAGGARDRGVRRERAVPHHVRHRVVHQEAAARVRQHAAQRRREAAEEVGDAAALQRGALERCGGAGKRAVGGARGWGCVEVYGSRWERRVLVVDFADDGG